MALVLAGGPASSADAPGASGVAEYLSLRKAEVNVRVGPGVQYPVKWKFRQRGMPVRVLARHGHWRKIRDWQGDVGWVHRVMVGGGRGAIVTAETASLHRWPSDSSPRIASLLRGVVGKLEECRPVWCRVEVQDHKGWVHRRAIWGASGDESAR